MSGEHCLLLKELTILCQRALSETRDTQERVCKCTWRSSGQDLTSFHSCGAGGAYLKDWKRLYCCSVALFAQNDIDLDPDLKCGKSQLTHPVSARFSPVFE